MSHERKTNKNRTNHTTKNDSVLNDPRSVLTMTSNVSPVAPRIRTKLHYNVTIQFAPGLPDQDYLFNLNSIFDPDLTGTGHQPLGFDQLKLFYGQYRVIRTAWRITWCSALFSAVNVIPNNSTTVFTGNPSTAREEPWAQYKYFGPGGNPITIRGQMNLHEICGKTRGNYNDDDVTAALISANPAQVCCLHIQPNSADGSTNITGSCNVHLSYDVEMFAPVLLSGS